jgi:hypothetical protein
LSASIHTILMLLRVKIKYYFLHFSVRPLPLFCWNNSNSSHVFFFKSPNTLDVSFYSFLEFFFAVCHYLIKISVLLASLALVVWIDTSQTIPSWSSIGASFCLPVKFRCSCHPKQTICLILFTLSTAAHPFSGHQLSCLCNNSWIWSLAQIFLSNQTCSWSWTALFSYSMSISRSK